MKRINASELVGRNLKVRDLLLLDEDIDVYDDVCEAISIAFCNPFFDDEVHEWDEYLTDRGMIQFREVLDYPIEINSETCRGITYSTVTVHVDDADENVWKTRLSKAKRFFYACAGYCADDDYKKWFKV